MSISKTSKMLNYINYRMRVTIQDSRQMVGTFLAFDKHMNLVLGDCMEFRKVRSKKGEKAKVEKRTLGLVLLRGETVVSMQIEAQPPKKARKGVAGMGGPGMAKAAARPLPTAPMMGAPQGLSGAVPGLGAPPAGLMMPALPAGMLPPGMMPPPGSLPGMPPAGMPPPPPQ